MADRSASQATEGPSPAPAWDRRGACVAVPLALIVFAAFLPVLGNGFVNWDDEKNFLNNPHYRGLGEAQVIWAWSTFLVGVYQPLAWLLLEAQYLIWGLNPFGYHLTSLLLHTAVAVLLYILTVTLLRRCQPDLSRTNPWLCFVSAGLATALFMVHPLRTEVVAWVSCQPYLPCALFYLLAILVYLRRFREDRSVHPGWPTGAFFLFVGALLCKAVAVSLPVVLVILDVYPLRRLGGGPGGWLGPSARKVWLEKIPFFALSLLFMCIAIVAKKHSSVLASMQPPGISSSQMAQACYGIWHYPVKTVLPSNITAYYALPNRVNWFAPRFLLSIVGTLGVSIGLFLLRRRWPGLLAAWLVYLVVVAPNLGLVRINNQIAGDRYSYVAMMGSVVVAAAGLCQLCQSGRWGRPTTVTLTAAGLAVIGGLVVLTWDQCLTWRTSETLWTHALNRGEASSTSEVQNFLGLALAQQGRIEEAKVHFAEALRLWPTYAEAHNNLGTALAEQAEYDGALGHFFEALRLNPSHVEAHNNVGSILVRQGKFDEAVAQYAESLRLDADNAVAHGNLEWILRRPGNLDRTVARYAAAIWLNPADTAAHEGLANALRNKDQLAPPR
jgi:tetratricopeptide (TPR) repeat protein